MPIQSWTYKLLFFLVYKSMIQSSFMDFQLRENNKIKSIKILLGQGLPIFTWNPTFATSSREMCRTVSISQYSALNIIWMDTYNFMICVAYKFVSSCLKHPPSWIFGPNWSSQIKRPNIAKYNPSKIMQCIEPVWGKLINTPNWAGSACFVAIATCYDWLITRMNTLH